MIHLPTSRCGGTCGSQLDLSLLSHRVRGRRFHLRRPGWCCCSAPCRPGRQRRADRRHHRGGRPVGPAGTTGSRGVRLHHGVGVCRCVRDGKGVDGWKIPIRGDHRGADGAARPLRHRPGRAAGQTNATAAGLPAVLARRPWRGRDIPSPPRRRRFCRAVGCSSRRYLPPGAPAGRAVDLAVVGATDLSAFTTRRSCYRALAGRWSAAARELRLHPDRRRWRQKACWWSRAAIALYVLYWYAICMAAWRRWSGRTAAVWAC